LRTCCIPRQPSAPRRPRKSGSSGAGTALTHVADDLRPGGPADRHDPFLRALAHDLERAVGPQIAQAQPGRIVASAASSLAIAESGNQ
jgi:hypothetical protein